MCFPYTHHSSGWKASWNLHSLPHHCHPCHVFLQCVGFGWIQVSCNLKKSFTTLCFKLDLPADQNLAIPHQYSPWKAHPYDHSLPLQSSRTVTWLPYEQFNKRTRVRTRANSKIHNSIPRLTETSLTRDLLCHRALLLRCSAPSCAANAHLHYTRLYTDTIPCLCR